MNCCIRRYSLYTKAHSGRRWRRRESRLRRRLTTTTALPQRATAAAQGVFERWPPAPAFSSASAFSEHSHALAPRGAKSSDERRMSEQTCNWKIERRFQRRHAHRHVPRAPGCATNRSAALPRLVRRGGVFKAALSDAICKRSGTSSSPGARSLWDAASITWVSGPAQWSISRRQRNKELHALHGTPERSRSLGGPSSKKTGQP